MITYVDWVNAGKFTIFLHLMYDMSLVEIIGVFLKILVYWWTVDHAQINVFLEIH